MQRVLNYHGLNIQFNDVYHDYKYFTFKTMTISTDIYHRLHPIGVQIDQHFSLLQNNTNTGLLDIV